MNDPKFTLVQLRYFAVAAELGSMTAASRQLMISQSAVSTAIAALESGLGVQLLLRHHARGLTLTAAGQQFHSEVRAFLAHASELADSARDAGSSLVGELAIGCFFTLGPFQLPALLEAFTARYPEVSVSVIEDEHAALKQCLRSGQCEIALMYGYDLDEDVQHVVVDLVRPYVIVSKSHPLAKRRRVRLAELASEPMVMLDLPHTSSYFESVFEVAGVTPSIQHRSRGFETVRALVASGRGYSLLNQRPAYDSTYDGGEVVTLEIRDVVEPLEIVLASMRGTRFTRRARAFVQTSRDAFAKSHRRRNEVR